MNVTYIDIAVMVLSINYDPRKRLENALGGPCGPPHILLTPQPHARTNTQPHSQNTLTTQPILGHTYTNHTNISPLIFPTISPIKQHAHTHINDTFAYIPPTNNINTLIPNILTPIDDTFLLHPNPTLYA